MRMLIDGTLVDLDIPEPTPEKHEAAIARREARRPSLSGLAFLERLTPSEYAGIVAAANEMLLAGQPQLSLWIDKLRVNGSINLAGEDAQGAKAFCVGAELLTQERADVIFG